MPSTITQLWACSRCGRQISVLRTDPDYERGEDILPPGEPAWEWVGDEHVCGRCLSWALSCGHSIPMLEHDRPDDPPRRPRMCPACQKLRNVTGTA